jgi:hypothetical protein
MVLSSLNKSTRRESTVSFWENSGIPRNRRNILTTDRFIVFCFVRGNFGNPEKSGSAALHFRITLIKLP